MTIAAALLALTLLHDRPSDGPAITLAEFRGWYEDSVRGRLRLPEDVRQTAKRHRFVFVGGLGNERMRGYFSQNARELRKQGVPRRSIHHINPSSHNTVEENRGAVRDAFFRIAKAGPERLVVIAHSRGACDALTFALDHPEFVRDRVDALFLVQGPFGGTALADYLLGTGEPLDDQMPRGQRWLARWLGRLEGFLFARGSHRVLVALARDESRAYWRRLLKEQADAVPVVGPKVYFIEAQTVPRRLRVFQRTAAWYLQTAYGPNDGVVVVDDQALAGLGTRLGTLEAGHADLTRRFPAARGGRRARRALIRSILMAVGRLEAPAEVCARR